MILHRSLMSVLHAQACFLCGTAPDKTQLRRNREVLCGHMFAGSLCCRCRPCCSFGATIARLSVAASSNPTSLTSHVLSFMWGMLKMQGGGWRSSRSDSPRIQFALKTVNQSLPSANKVAEDFSIGGQRMGITEGRTAISPPTTSLFIMWPKTCYIQDMYRHTRPLFGRKRAFM